MSNILTLCHLLKAPTPDGAIHTSPAGQFDTPSAQNAATPSRGAPQEESPTSDPEKTEIISPSQYGIASVGEDLKATTTNTTGATNDELSSQLSDAKAQIQKLKEAISNNELRQRKSGGKGDTSASGLQQQQQPQVVETGVPLQTAAALCLLSFLIAFFFF